MVQLQNADRLNVVLELGTTDDSAVDEDGAPVIAFKSLYRVLGGKWTLTTSQIVQQEGLGRTDTSIYIVRHRPNYDGVTQAKIGDKVYDISDINQDPFNNPTAFDQLTLKETDKNG